MLSVSLALLGVCIRRHASGDILVSGRESLNHVPINLSYPEKHVLLGYRVKEEWVNAVGHVSIVPPAHRYNATMAVQCLALAKDYQRRKRQGIVSQCAVNTGSEG